MLVKDFPEIKQLVRIHRLKDQMTETPRVRERMFEPVFAADSNIFRLFTFHFLEGNPDNALLDPQTLVITRRIAMKYFDRVDVVGESLNFPADTMSFKITGVIEDYPSNTHLKLDLITSFETLKIFGYKTTAGGTTTSTIILSLATTLIPLRSRKRSNSYRKSISPIRRSIQDTGRSTVSQI
jgi:putative ABC transport system permease protein